MTSERRVPVPTLEIPPIPKKMPFFWNITIAHSKDGSSITSNMKVFLMAIRNNVFGTLAIIKAAKLLGVENFVLISGDKAVRPTNIMGSTKRIAELICQAFAKESSKTKFSMVRFGNVLGSSGSVIPRFQKQIENGGPITVTHKDMVRYFMTISEAAQLVIQAAAMAKGGDVFILDMGQPMKIVDIALSMVQLSGMKPVITDEPNQNDLRNNEIAICFTGLRKGEKLHEEMLIGDNTSTTQHPRIISASEISLPLKELMPALDRLFLACEQNRVDLITQILYEMPLGYSPLSNTD